MNLNATLFGQMIVFALFVWFTMKYVWPPLVAALEQRRQKIAEGLEAAEQGRRSWDQAQQKIDHRMKEIQDEAREILNHANTRGIQMIEEATIQARDQASHVMKSAEEQMRQEAEQMKGALRQQVADLTLLATSKLLQRHITPELDDKMLAQLIDEV